jgi:hypothetical protein
MEERAMSLKTTGERFVVESSRTYAFVRLAGWEVYVDLTRDGGPVGRRIIFSRA